MSTQRPNGITALAVFSGVGAIISSTAAVSLLVPGSFLEPMWRLNPRARPGFASLGPWAVVLLGVVCVGCCATGVGLWRRARWGHRLAVAGLAINLAGDLLNGTIGGDWRALVGVPIAGALLAYLLSARVRRHFAESQPVVAEE